MRPFFHSVLKHLDKLDETKLREQYRLALGELEKEEKILSALDRGVVSLDEHGDVSFANPAAVALLGEPLEENIRELAIPRHTASKIETTRTYPEVRTLEIQTFPVEAGLVILLRDTTSEKARTEEELRAGATKAVCDLAAGVAHEIGNPLNAISMNLQLLERDPTDKTSLEICQAQVKRLDGIIREFLSALRARKPVLVPGSPADPLKACLTALRPQFLERDIRVTLDLPSALPSVALDRDLIEQVFFNLVKNALEAMKDGASLSIALSSDDRDVLIVFRDTGEGMTTEQLTHLFEPYRTTKEKGTGLGLMVSKRIIADHGGTIAVESAPGEGTTMTIRLPRLEKRVRQLK